jgi:DNA-directed RNA polymerase specialized sigma24 family protein
LSSSKNRNINSIETPVKTELFSDLLSENKERIYWLIRKLVFSHEDPNDINQNVFLKVWKSLDNFKGNSSKQTREKTTSRVKI